MYYFSLIDNLQCFDTVGWVTRKAIQLMKKFCSINLTRSGCKKLADVTKNQSSSGSLDVLIC